MTLRWTDFSWSCATAGKGENCAQAHNFLVGLVSQSMPSVFQVAICVVIELANHAAQWQSWTNIRQWFMIRLLDVNGLVLTVYVTEDSIIERSWARWDRDCFIAATREQQTTHSAHARVLHCCALSYIRLFSSDNINRKYKQINRQKAKKTLGLQGLDICL